MVEIPRGTIQPTLAVLQPGVMIEPGSEEGFLDRGQTLEEVINRDRQALNMLGYTQQEVADLLGPVTEKAANERDFEYTAPNGKQYHVRVQKWRGGQECPWEDEVGLGKSRSDMDMHLTEKGKGEESVRIAGLIRHLVESHGFFEGGSYRVAPERVVEMFGTERIPGSFDKVRELKL